MMTLPSVKHLKDEKVSADFNGERGGRRTNNGLLRFGRRPRGIWRGNRTQEILSGTFGWPEAKIRATKGFKQRAITNIRVETQKFR
jgi:hypothetical protein